MSNAAGIKAGRAYVEVGASDGPFRSVMKAVEGRLSSIGKYAASIGNTLMLGQVVQSARGLITSFSESGSVLDDMAQRTGASVESLSELQYAFQQSGTDSAALEAGLIKVNKLLGDAANGEKGATDALSALGTSFEELKDLSPDQQFETLISKLGGIEDIGRRTTVAMAIFGKSGASLLPLVGQIDALRAKARELGLTMSTEDAQAAAAFGDAMDNLGSAAGSITNKIGAALAPTITVLTENIAKNTKVVGDWIGENKGLVIGVAAVTGGVAAAGIAFLGLSVATSVAAGGVGLVMTILGAILSPIGLVTAALGGLGYLIVTQTDMGKAGLSSLVSTALEIAGPIKDTFQGIFDAIGSGDLELAGQIAMKGLEVAWLAGLEVLSDSWDTTIIYLEGALDQFQTSASQIWLTITDNLVGAFDAGYASVKKVLVNIVEEAAEAAVAAQETLGLVSKEVADATRSVIDIQANVSRDVIDGELKNKNKERAAATEGAMDQLTADAEKRAKGRQGRLDSLGGDSASLTTAKSELQALIAQAEKEKAIAVTPDQQKRGQAAIDATRTIVESRGAAGAAFGSSSAASSIARAANGTGMNQLIAESKRQTEALKRLESAVKNQPVIEVTEVDN